ncbi:hypothetical protein HA402_011670 [Bradysia odoriphaga]|nr:hypothetical protein HA402_011670 [Bradysia odoriphaga]
MSNLTDEQRIELIKKNIGSFPDFPKEGILFRDIFSALTSGDVCVALKDLLVSYVRKNHPDVDVIVGLEARGFLFSLLLAAEIGDEVEIQKSSIKAGQKVIVLDDLLATGGTLDAATKLLKMAGANVVECIVLIELSDLKGREKIPETNIHSFIQY